MKFFNEMGLKSRNIYLIYASMIAGGLLFFLPILALYFEETLFTATNVALIFSIEAIAMVLFEVPTGAIADLFGRKKTLVLANFVVLIAVSFLYIGGSMLMFILFAIFNSFARALSSGTYNAFIYDSLKEENKEKYYKKVIGTFHALWPLGASIGSIIGGYLAKVSLSFPIGLSLIPLFVAFILTLKLKEPDYEKEEHRNILKHMFESSKLILKNKQLILLVIGGFLLLAFGETVHLLSPLFFKFKEIPIMFFGWIMAFVFGLSSLGYYLSHTVSEKIGNKTTLIASVIIAPILLIIATLTTKFTSILFFIIPSFFFGLRNPVRSHLLNVEVPSSKRATIISISNFLGQLGVAIFAPFIGYFAELYTINTAFMISAIFMFSATILFFFVKNRE
jgi:MFS family permease|tara:strand:+ start:1009 stop:2187 length:1179 start_codon:yes stop_codon:yes gene_type:complete